MRRSFLILIIFLFIFNLAYGEEFFLQGVIFKGIKFTPYSQIQDLINIKPFQSYTKEKIEEEIKKIKDTKIFEDVAYSLNKINGGYELIIEVKEYPVIEKVVFPKIRLLDEKEIRKNIYSDSGRFFILAQVQEDIDKIKNLYKNYGFLLVEEPKFKFERNILSFTWKELLPIKEIIYETKSYKEEEIIKKLVNIKIGEDLNIKKIDLANQKLLRDGIPLIIKYNYKLEEDGTILYLSLVYLFKNSISFSLTSPLNFHISYSFYDLNWGRITLNSLIMRENPSLYKLTWEKENFHVLLDNNYISLLFLREFGEDVIAKVGYRFALNPQGNKALLFSFEKNTLIKREFINTNGNLLCLSLDFIGGGSPENYTLLRLLTDNYWSYGEKFEERILEAKGELRYVLGKSQEKSGINIKFSYGFPLSLNSYIFINIGGESEFDSSEIKSLSDVIFNLWGGLDFIWTDNPWILKSSIILKSIEKLEWKACTTINF
ncbi:MAG: hypothetical protein NZ841_03665 [Dictyoglomus sp.]|nr:hypothetical protein [Dictyoglomus sp.]MDW8188375.1 hypothetical protein [Dictyoglomus sp.]